MRIRLTIDRSSRPEVFYKIGVLKNFEKFTGKFCEIFKNTFFHRTPPVATSVYI